MTESFQTSTRASLPVLGALVDLTGLDGIELEDAVAVDGSVAALNGEVGTVVEVERIFVVFCCGRVQSVFLACILEKEIGVHRNLGGMHNKTVNKSVIREQRHFETDKDA